MVPQSHAADTGGLLNRQAAVTQVQEHSTDMWNLRESIRFTDKAYRDQMVRAGTIDTEKFTFHNPYTDEDEFFYYDNPVRMQLRLAKEFYPEQMKFEVERLEKTLDAAENAMANAADSLFSGLYGTYQNRLLAQKSLEVAQKALVREETRYKNGLTTSLELEGSRLEVETCKNAIAKADRDYENIHRQFNRMAGLPLDFRYEMVGTPFVTSNKITISEDQAVADALKNRREIWELNRKIQLVNFRMEIYQYKNVHLTDKQTREYYADSWDELENLKQQLAEKSRAIEKEIRKAYQELKISFLDLEIMKLELAKQKNQLETVSNQYKSGLIPVTYVEQLENAVNQLETAVNMNMITTLVKKDQFSRAISIGPGY
jgi:hypothetical protein